MNKIKNNGYQEKQQRVHCSLKYQKGVVLIWAVVFLFVITIVGLSAIRMSGIDTQISGNSVTSMLTYQGAESALGHAVPDNQRKVNIFQASLSANVNNGYDVPANHFELEPVSGGGQLVSGARVQVEEQGVQCPFSMPATSSEIRCHVYRVDATTMLQGTGVKAQHTEAIAEFVPQ